MGIINDNILKRAVNDSEYTKIKKEISKGMY